MVNRLRRMAPALIEEDEKAFAALKAMTDYAPSNTAYTVAAIERAAKELADAETAETQADAAAKAASDTVAEKQAAFHNLIAGATDQVIAQYGRNSNQAQSLGRKKPSEYKKPQRKAKKGSGEDGGASRV